MQENQQKPAKPFKTTKTKHGDWQVVGYPLAICKEPYAPKWGERQGWYIALMDADYGQYGDGRPLGGGYGSKAHALEALEILADALCARLNTGEHKDG